MREKTKSGKALKVISAIFLSLALLIMSVLIVADIFLDDYLKDTISQEVNEGSDGLYQLDIESLDLNLRTFKVVLKNIDFSTDEALYLEQKDDEEPSPYIDLKTDELSISQVNILGFLFRDRLQISNIYVKNPVANLRVPESEEPIVIEEIWKDIEDFAESLLIGKIEIENLHLDMDFELSDEWHNMTLAKVGFIADGLRIDSASAYDEDRFIYTNRMRLDIQDTAIFDLAGMYKGSLSSIMADTDKGVQARNIVLSTNDSLYQDAVSRQRVTEAYIELALEDLDLAFEEWGKILQGGEMHAQHLVVHNSDIYFVAPPSMPGGGGKESGYPRQERGFRMALHETINDQFPLLTIDSVRFHQANVQALIPEGPDTLSLSVPDLNLFLTDIRLDAEGAEDPERFMYASEASLLTRKGINVNNKEIEVTTDKLLVSTDSGLFINNIQLSGSMLENSEGSLARLGIQFTEWGKLQQGDTTHVQSIAFEQPRIRARLDNQANGNAAANGTAQQGFRLDVHQSLDDFVALLTIGNVSVSDADIYASVKNGKDRLMVEVPDLNISLSDLHFDESGAKDADRFLYAREASLMTRKGVNVKQGEEFTLKTDMLIAASDSGIFGRNIKYSAAPTMNAFVESLNINFTQWGNLQQGQATHIGSVAVSNPVIRANIEGDTSEATSANGERGFQLDLHEGLNDFVSQLTIGSVHVSNADINASMADSAGKMVFEVPDLNISLSNVRLDAHGAKDANRFLYAQKASLMTRKGINVNGEGLLLTTDMLVVSTDSGVFANNLYYAGSASPDIEATIQAINIHFKQWGQLQQGDVTHIESVAFNGPDIKAVMEAPAEEESEADEDQEEWAERHPETPPVEGVDLQAIPSQLSEFVELLTIGNLVINNGNFDIEMAGENEDFPVLLNVQGFSLAMEDIRLDSLAAQSTERFLFAEDIHLTMQKLESRPDQMYDMGFENLRASSKEKSLSLNNMTLKPRYPKREFAEVVGEETQRMDLELSQFEIEGFDYHQLLDFRFIVDLVKVDGVDWEIFVDSHLPSEEPEPPLYPHDMLSSLEAYIHIKEIQIDNGHVVYEELAEGGDESGAFTFEDFSVNIKDVVNRNVEGYEYTKISLNFDLMGTGDFSGELVIPLLHPDKYFAFSGGMEPMNLEKLNPALEYIAFTRIDNGHMHSFRFQGEGNNERITGEVFANYEGLTVEFLEAGPEEPGFLTGVVSSIANRILSTDNLKGTDDFTIGEMDLERDENQTFLGVFIEGLNRGLFDSFGVQRVMDAVEAIQDVVPFLGDEDS